MASKETINETSLNTSNHLKEFGYLNQLKGKIPFDLCEDNVYCKKNFFSTLARYIEILKKENTEGWENEIQDFINSIINGNLGKGFDLLKNINTYLCEKQLKRYKEIGYKNSAKIMEDILKMKHLFRERDNGKTRSSIAGIRTDLIPKRFFEWTNNSGLLKEIREENVKNLADALSGKK